MVPSLHTSPLCMGVQRASGSAEQPNPRSQWGIHISIFSFSSQHPPGKPECRVGQYVVDLASFEQLALPVLRNTGPSHGPGHSVCIIDEIGKMELFSQPFIQAVRQTLSTPGTVVLGTIPVPKGKPLALVEEIRNRHDVKVFSVTKENRNSLLTDIVTCVQSSRTGSSS